jgi:hypothetical protein
MTSDQPGLERSKFVTGFQVLLSECLQVSPNDDVLVIYDEAFGPFLDALVELATRTHLRMTFVFFPKKYQRAVIGWAGGDEHEIDLPQGIASACGEASVILNCLDGDLETGSLRGAILNRLRPKECRFAHIPGLSGDILGILTQSPIKEVLDSAETVAWALGEARAGRLTSRFSANRECHLHFELDGWDNEPMMSPGVIFPGSWGNSPPGEVFCCPDPERIHGDVCINGSVPGMSLQPQDATILRFKRGRLVHWWPEGTAAASFLDTQKRAAAVRSDENWGTFAELGIGLNPAVAALTGNALLDEKALGTIHIAIGDNRSFGHSVKSFIHADMVIREPTLELDGSCVLERGQLLMESLKRLRQQMKPKALQFSPETRLVFRDAKLEFRNGKLSRRLVSAGRVGYVPISELAAEDWLQDLIRDLRGGAAVNYSHLQTVAEPSRVQYALEILHHYRIVTLENPSEKNGGTAYKSSARGSIVRQHRAESR